jgi:hypothetical protein
LVTSLHPATSPGLTRTARASKSSQPPVLVRVSTAFHHPTVYAAARCATQLPTPSSDLLVCPSRLRLYRIPPETMLARGVLCRVAADVPKTSTHDLSQLARILRRTTLTRNGASFTSIRALSYAGNAPVAHFRRSYASAASATKPTATVKRAVKKAAAKKPASKTTTAKRSTKGTPAKKRTKAKAKKPAAKKRARAKKELTVDEKEKATLRELRKVALKDPGRGHINAWIAFLAEESKGKKGIAVGANAAAHAAKFKNLTAAEREVSKQTTWPLRA